VFTLRASKDGTEQPAKTRFLPAATEPMSAKAGMAPGQPAKTTLFAGVNGADVRKSGDGTGAAGKNHAFCRR
jgi:hypothetical protein